MSDLYFCPPFLWGDKLQDVVVDGRPVAWLLAVPISRAEADFAEREGPQKMEALFERERIDIYDLNRPSLV